MTDPVLLALAGKSLRLETLDLSGSLVTPDGLRQLAAAHAAGRPAAAAAATAGTAGASAAGLAAAGEAAAAPASAPAVVAGAAGAALRVRDLQLDGSGLACDAGLVAVGECCCDSLEQLVVRNAGARLGDEGIRGLRACTKLAALDVAACSVTEEGEVAGQGGRHAAVVSTKGLLSRACSGALPGGALFVSAAHVGAAALLRCAHLQTHC